MVGAILKRSKLHISRPSSLAAVFLFVLTVTLASVPAPTASAAPSWTELQPAGAVNSDWNVAVMSGDDQYALAGGPRLYLIKDNNTFAEVRPAGNIDANWQSLAMSNNGRTMLAGGNGRLYISQDYGQTWSETQPAGNVVKTWRSLTVSDNGQVIIAGVMNGRMYRSVDGGATWAETQPAGNADKWWMSLDMTPDASTILAGGGSAGRLYKSTDKGQSWAEMRPGGDTDYDWRGADVSDDGQKFFVAARYGRAYISTNAGTSWTETRPIGDTVAAWRRSSMSGDGQSIFTSYDSGRLYYTTNGGTNWTETQPSGTINRFWYGLSVSDDGGSMIAASYSGRLYVSGVIGDGSTGGLANADSDGDGFKDTDEQGGPNGGDANDDGVLDDLQPHVTSIKNPQASNAYIGIELANGCSISSASTKAESANSQVDAGYSYPSGMLDFTANCGSNGFVTTVEQYYYDTTDDSYILRKYDPTSNTYATVSGVTKQTLIAAPHTVLKVSYSVTDGGSLDADGVANGVIVDPVGLAAVVAAVNGNIGGGGSAGGASGGNAGASQGQGGGQLADTGVNPVVPGLVAVGLIVTAGAVVLGLRRNPQHQA